MKKFGDPNRSAKTSPGSILRRRRWLYVLLKTTTGAGPDAADPGVVGYSAYWYFALSRPIAREPAPTPIASAAATLAAIQAAQDGYARQIHSVRFRGSQTVHSFNGAKDEGEFTHTYEAVSKGALYYSREIADERYGAKPDETRHSDDVWVFDGRTMRNLLTEWNGPDGSARAKETYGVSAYLRDKQFKPHDPDEVLRIWLQSGWCLDQRHAAARQPDGGRDRPQPSVWPADCRALREHDLLGTARDSAVVACPPAGLDSR